MPYSSQDPVVSADTQTEDIKLFSYKSDDATRTKRRRDKRVENIPHSIVYSTISDKEYELTGTLNPEEQNVLIKQTRGAYNKKIYSAHLTELKNYLMKFLFVKGEAAYSNLAPDTQHKLDKLCTEILNNIDDIADGKINFNDVFLKRLLEIKEVGVNIEDSAYLKAIKTYRNQGSPIHFVLGKGQSRVRLGRLKAPGPSAPNEFLAFKKLVPKTVKTDAEASTYIEEGKKEFNFSQNFIKPLLESSSYSPEQKRFVAVEDICLEKNSQGIDQCYLVSKVYPYDKNTFMDACQRSSNKDDASQLLKKAMLSLGKSIELLMQHQIYHADMKADNIIFDMDYNPYIMDWGSSAHPNEQGQMVIVDKTDLRYVPPETILYVGSEHPFVLTKAEEWRLGLTILELIPEIQAEVNCLINDAKTEHLSHLNFLIKGIDVVNAYYKSHLESVRSALINAGYDSAFVSLLMDNLLNMNPEKRNLSLFIYHLDKIKSVFNDPTVINDPLQLDEAPSNLYMMPPPLQTYLLEQAKTDTDELLTNFRHQKQNFLTRINRFLISIPYLRNNFIKAHYLNMISLHKQLSEQNLKNEVFSDRPDFADKINQLRQCEDELFQWIEKIKPYATDTIGIEHYFYAVNKIKRMFERFIKTNSKIETWDESQFSKKLTTLRQFRQELINQQSNFDESKHHFGKSLKSIGEVNKLSEQLKSQMTDVQSEIERLNAAYQVRFTKELFTDESQKKTRNKKLSELADNGNHYVDLVAQNAYTQSKLASAQPATVSSTTLASSAYDKIPLVSSSAAKKSKKVTFDDKKMVKEYFVEEEFEEVPTAKALNPPGSQPDTKLFSLYENSVSTAQPIKKTETFSQSLHEENDEEEEIPLTNKRDKASPIKKNIEPLPVIPSVQTDTVDVTSGLSIKSSYTDTMKSNSKLNKTKTSGKFNALTNQNVQQNPVLKLIEGVIEAKTIYVEEAQLSYRREVYPNRKILIYENKANDVSENEVERSKHQIGAQKSLIERMCINEFKDQAFSGKIFLIEGKPELVREAAIVLMGMGLKVRLSNGEIFEPDVLTNILITEKRTEYEKKLKSQGQDFWGTAPSNELYNQNSFAKKLNHLNPR